MSGEGSPPPANWPALDPTDQRILGVLIEKAKTTPDAYPLSLNALVTGCNQKSNREPVMALNDLEVEDALGRLQRNSLVSRLAGTRVDRWRHELYEAWKLDKVDLAIVCELFLRGAQTEGELRSHVSRMESFADLDALRTALKPLVDRGLVVYLTPPGRRGSTLTHGCHAPEELDGLRKRAESAAEAPAPAPAASKSDEIAQLRQELQDLRARVQILEDLAKAVRPA